MNVPIAPPHSNSSEGITDVGACVCNPNYPGPNGGPCVPSTLGCDGVWDSGAVYDACGVCFGDNSSCTAFGSFELHSSGCAINEYGVVGQIDVSAWSVARDGKYCGSYGQWTQLSSSVDDVEAIRQCKQICDARDASHNDCPAAMCIQWHGDDGSGYNINCITCPTGLSTETWTPGYYSRTYVG